MDNDGGYQEPDNWKYWGVFKTLILGRGRSRGSWAEQQSQQRGSEGHVEDCYYSIDAGTDEDDIYFSGRKVVPELFDGCAWFCARLLRKAHPG